MPRDAPSPLRLIRSASTVARAVAGSEILEATLSRTRLTADPATALVDMRLTGELRQFLEREAPRFGLAVEDADAKDRHTPIKRAYTLVRGQGRDLAFLHVPEWIVGNGTQVVALEMIRSAFGGRTLFIVSESLEQATLGLNLILDDWRERDRIVGRFLSWRNIGEMLSGAYQLPQVLGLPLDEVAPPAAPAPAPALALLPQPPAPGRRDVFISYSHRDGRWLKGLQIQLKPLLRKGEFKAWSDKDIKKGAKWQEAIAQALAAAKVGVLLVSPDFLASDFITEKELPPLLKAAKDEGLVILWVHLSECNYEASEIGQYQAAHDIAKPLDALSKAERNKVLKEISQAIHEALDG